MITHLILTAMSAVIQSLLFNSQQIIHVQSSSIIEKDLELIVKSIIDEGTKRGINECHHQFVGERWNCTDFTPTNRREDAFLPTIERGSRETAFLYAITSAGVVHAVTEACSAGNLTDCSCDPSKIGKSGTDRYGHLFKWGGCSDNVRYGMMFAKHFIDYPDRQSRRQNPGDVRALMNIHNNRAGRLAVANHMETRCRCHGISGSCELKTCWKMLPSFTKVGKELKTKYDSATQLTESSTRRIRKNKLMTGSPGHFIEDNHPRSYPIPPHDPLAPISTNKVKRKVVQTPKENLVYIQKSPNYCIEDRSKGIFGTTGRTCSKSTDEASSDSCNLLCCGRGYNTMIRKESQRCDCLFEWCCNVKCRVCDTETEVYTCK